MQAALNSQLGHSAGIIPGDQHILVNIQGQTIKGPFAQNISQGFSGNDSGYGSFHLLTDLFRSKGFPVRNDLLVGFTGHITQQTSCKQAGCLIVLQQHKPAARIQIKFGILLYQRSSPSLSGRTAVTAAIPTSIILSSGSLVVKFCIHIPGAVKILVNQLS